ncbi:hypothetical protein [Microbacterium sp. LWS13-1.2]|uniref:Uncharacterized protein n=1 Tax=Microbacterium sp. LWS13-1.2 TaxID=3135264 RepID=A0AAU6SEJ4_9MICO
MIVQATQPTQASSPVEFDTPGAGGITVPTRYVLASGTSFGSKGDGQEKIRASVPAVAERNPHITIQAKVASNHAAILRKDFRAIAEAVRGVAG